MIIDHTSVELYDDIPAFYLAETNKMAINVMGESHAVGITAGASLLYALDENYPASVDQGTSPEGYRDDALRVYRFRYDTFWYPSTGEEHWFTNAAGIAGIKAHLQQLHDGNYSPSIVMFGWCWDMVALNASDDIDSVYKCHWYGRSAGGPEGNLEWGLDSSDYSLTGNTVCLDTYLAATEEYISYCNANSIPITIVFTTGPMGDYTGEYGYQRQLKHDRIRDYVTSNPDRILFDYGDILAYNDSDQQNQLTWYDGESNPHLYQHLHADNDGEDYGHIGEVGCVRLGKALRVLAARVAGWGSINQATATRSRYARFVKRAV